MARAEKMSYNVPGVYSWNPVGRYGMGDSFRKEYLNMKPTKYGKKWEIAYRIPGYLKMFHERFDTEAKVRCAEIELSREMGTLAPPRQSDGAKKRRGPTLNEFLTEYVNNYGVKKWGDSQYSVCTCQIRNYVNPHPIGAQRITHINTKDIDQFYTDLMTTPAVLRQGHRDTGKTAGPSVIEKLTRLAAILGEKPELLDLLLAVAG